MRAIVFDGASLRRVDDLEVGGPGPGEVRVRVLASGICQSDLHVVDGGYSVPPVVLGHEGAGEVVEIGSAVSGVRVGERVVISTMTPCGACRACAARRISDCAQSYGRGQRPFSLGEVSVAQYANASTFAEEVVVRADQLYPIDDLSPVAASLIGCAVSTGYGNVVNVAGVRPGDSVVVIGIGGIGASVVQTARIAGAERIVAVDVDPLRRALAEQFGATEVLVVDPSDDLVAAVLDHLGQGADHVFECVGCVSTIEAAIGLTGIGGTAVMIGMPPAGARISFAADPMFRGRRIVGSLNGAIDPDRDVPEIIRLASVGAFDLDGLVSEVYPFDRWADAIAATRSGRVIRSVIDFTA